MAIRSEYTNVGSESHSGLTIPLEASSADLSHLPYDLQSKIFAHLGIKDIVKVSLANREMKRLTSETMQLEIVNFISLLIEQFALQGAEVEKERLSLILEKMRSQPTSDAKFFKKCLLEVKAELVSVIKLRYDFLINEFQETVKPPRFYEDIFAIAKLERQIDSIQSSRGSSAQLFLSAQQNRIKQNQVDFKLLEISRAFIELRCYRRAMEVTQSLSNQDLCTENLKSILCIVCPQDAALHDFVDFTLAFEIADLIPTPMRRLEENFHLCRIMEQKGLSLQKSGKLAEGQSLIDRANAKRGELDQRILRYGQPIALKNSTSAVDGACGIGLKLALAFTTGYAVTALSLKIIQHYNRFR